MIQTHMMPFGHSVRVARLELQADLKELLSPAVLGSHTAFKAGKLIQMLTGSFEDTTQVHAISGTVQLGDEQLNLAIDVVGPLPWEGHAPSVLLSINPAGRETLADHINSFDPESEAIFALATYDQSGVLAAGAYKIVPHVAIINTPALAAEGVDPVSVAIATIMCRQAVIGLVPHS